MFEPNFGLQSITTDFNTFTGFDAPIFTSDGFITSLALLAPISLKVFKENKVKWVESGWIPRPLVSGINYVLRMRAQCTDVVGKAAQWVVELLLEAEEQK